jgi:hypothetical protein
MTPAGPIRAFLGIDKWMGRDGRPRGFKCGAIRGHCCTGERFFLENKLRVPGRETEKP